MTMKYEITRRLRGDSGHVYVCIGCRELALESFPEETVPYKVPAWLDYRKNDIKSTTCRRCWDSLGLSGSSCSSSRATGNI